jgi:PBP1b-binding outer membrane lipoprotein LpoB
MNKKMSRMATTTALIGLLSGCAVVSTTASVTGAVVSTAVGVTTTAVGVGIDATKGVVHLATPD